MVKTEAQTCMRDAQEPMRFVLACDILQGLYDIFFGCTVFWLTLH